MLAYANKIDARKMRNWSPAIVKRTSVQKSNKNDIFMARVKNSNCLNFCTQVDPSKTRKAVYFFPQMYFNFREKTNLSLSHSGIDESGHIKQVEN